MAINTILTFKLPLIGDGTSTTFTVGLAATAAVIGIGLGNSSSGQITLGNPVSIFGVMSENPSGGALPVTGVLGGNSLTGYTVTLTFTIAPPSTGLSNTTIQVVYSG